MSGRPIITFGENGTLDLIVAIAERLGGHAIRLNGGEDVVVIRDVNRERLIVHRVVGMYPVGRPYAVAWPDVAALHVY